MTTPGLECHSCPAVKVRSPNPGNTLPARLARYARVSAVIGRFASRLAGERYLGVRHEPGELARELQHALGRLRGPVVKVAQLLATMPGALPSDYVAELLKLQSQAPPMGWTFVKRRMAGELGADWSSKFAEFERTAAAAASLGQVHRAVGLDGRQLACKLQYPDMSSAVDADLRELDLVLRVLQQYQRALSMGNVRAELEARLHEELDYQLEARHMALYREMLGGEREICVSEPVPELSTRRLLTMTWLEGQPILEGRRRTHEQSAALAILMFRAWYLPFFRYGVIHGDPHLGNYTVRADGTLNLLDFGCVRIFPPPLVQGVIDLYEAVRTGNQDLAVHAYRSWGFHHLTRPIIDALNVWAGFLYEPVLEDKRRTLGALTGEIHGREIAERVIAELHQAGGVEVPREFVIMDRAAIGLSAVFLHLQAEVNWHRLFSEVVADFDLAALERRQVEILTRHGIPLPLAAARRDNATS